MSKAGSATTQPITQAAIAFEQRLTGNHVPRSVTVVLSEGTPGDHAARGLVPGREGPGLDSGRWYQ